MANRNNRRWGHRQRNIARITDPKPDDIIIPILGPTGAGKSTFINTAARKYVTKVGHDLRSCTADIQPVVVPYPGDPNRRVVFVDTLGFDDTFLDDHDVLEDIAKWLKRSYQDKIKVTGIFYLHEITQTRMLGTARRNFIMFDKLCGDEAAKNVLLLTTKWGHVKTSVGIEREKQLSEVYWKDMLDHGSKLYRFEDSYDSAWDIVASVAERVPLEVIQIQKELVDLGKLLPETEAGKALHGELKEMLEQQRARARALQAARTPEADAEHQEVVDRIRSIIDQIQDLKIPLGQRIMRFFGITSDRG